MRLNRELVIRRALKLVGEVGIEELTTRRLGKELGVEGPALYRRQASGRARQQQSPRKR